MYFPTLAHKGTPPQIRENIRVEATDTGDGWTLVPGGRVIFGPGDSVPDATISGQAADLYLVLWGRLPDDRLAVEGAVATEFLNGPTSG